MTILDLITASLRRLGVLAAGEVPTAEDASDALDTLNQLLDSWATERLQIPTVTRTTWTIVSGTQNYTLGSTGTIAVARPVIIEHINFQDTSQSPTYEYQMQPHTEDSWARLPIKSLTSPFPESWYYNPTYPTGTLSLFPVPTSSTLQGVLYAPAAVARFAATSDTVSLQPGYERMLITNLALELAPEFEREPHPLLVKTAVESKANVKRANIRMLDLSIEAGALIGVYGSGSGYDIRSDS